MRQKRRSKRSRRPVLRIAVGNISEMDVITTSIATNCTERGRDRIGAFPNVKILFQKEFMYVMYLLVCPDPRE